MRQTLRIQQVHRRHTPKRFQAKKSTATQLELLNERSKSVILNSSSAKHLTSNNLCFMRKIKVWVVFSTFLPDW